MNLARQLFAVSAMTVLAGCATNGFTIENIDPPIGREVSAEVSVFNVLGLTPTEIADIENLREELAEQCEGGTVTGIATLSSTVWVVIGVLEKSRVVGYCSE